MSASTTAFDWGLAWRQVQGIFRLELRKNLFSGRGMVVYMLAFVPVGLIMIWSMSPATEMLKKPAQGGVMFAGLFPVYLAVSLYLSALLIFMSLFRNEILEKSLHYYFLTPVRREVLVVGKYVTALLALAGVYLVSTSLLYAFTMLPFGSEGLKYVMSGAGFGHLISYLGIVLLACVGYGAVFLLAGLIFRNPIVPAALIWGWEAINFILPAWLKKVSVVFYLKSLYPVPVIEQSAWKSAFSVLAEPTSAWISVPGLLIFTAAVLFLAGRKARSLEITYAED
jgi:ABC-type transport system involved in multi-copper enzyme maturation permease subunit